MASFCSTQNISVCSRYKTKEFGGVTSVNMKVLLSLLALTEVKALSCYGCEAQTFNGELISGSMKCFDMSKSKNQEGDHFDIYFAGGGSCVGKYEMTKVEAYSSDSLSLTRNFV